MFDEPDYCRKLDPDHKGYITKRQIFDFFMDDDIPDLPEIIKKADVEKNGKIDLNGNIHVQMYCKT